MGADLYISSISEKCTAKYEPLFNSAVQQRNYFQNRGNQVEAEKAQKEVTKYYNLMNSEGYFRDSYNGTALMRYLFLTNEEGQLDTLSWWRDITVLQDRKGNISGKNLEKFLTIILAAELRLPTKEELIANHCQVDESGDDSVEGWHKYLTEKRSKLIDMICQAIEMNEPISASL
mgnify:CR=1 FL=1